MKKRIVELFQTIQQLLALGAGAGDSPFTISSLAIHSSSFLFLFILAYGIATPGGIFMPSIMVSTLFLCSYDAVNTGLGMKSNLNYRSLISAVSLFGIRLRACKHEFVYVLHVERMHESPGGLLSKN